MNISPINYNTYNRPNFGTRLDKSLKPFIEEGIQRGVIGEKELNNLRAITNDGLDGRIWMKRYDFDLLDPYKHQYDLIFENPIILKLREKFSGRVIPVDIWDPVECFITSNKMIDMHDKRSYKDFAEIMTPENIKKAHEKSKYLENYYKQEEIKYKNMQHSINSLFD